MSFALRVGGEIVGFDRTVWADDLLMDEVSTALVDEINRSDVTGFHRYVLRSTNEDPGNASSFLTCKGRTVIDCSADGISLVFTANLESGRFAAANVGGFARGETADLVVAFGRCIAYYD